MPQLDTATYLSQVFWLTLFFVTYYRLVLKFILPSLAGRRKARSKKVALAKGRVSGFDGERTSALNVYDTAVGTSSAWLSRHTLTAVSQGDAWRSAEGRAADESALVKGNLGYLSALSGVAAQRLLVSGRKASLSIA